MLAGVRAVVFAAVAAVMVFVGPGSAHAEEGQGVVPVAARNTATILFTIGGTTIALGVADIALAGGLLVSAAAMGQGLAYQSSITLAGNTTELPGGLGAVLLMVLPATVLTLVGLALIVAGGSTIAGGVVVKELFG